MKKKRAVEAIRVTVWGMIGNLLLILFKLVAGILGHSRAIIADAAHSVSDFASDLVVIAGVKLGNRPPDSTHRYGHGKFETLAAFLLGGFLLATALGIAVSSGEVIVRYIRGMPLQPPGWIAAVAAATSILVKEVLYRFTHRVGNRIRSQAVIANAVHHRSDALSSAGVLLGVAGAILLGPPWRILDALAAVIVVVFILRSALSILRKSVDELLETSLDEGLNDHISELVSAIQGVENPHNVKTRRIGNTVAVDLHIDVSPHLNVREAHAIATGVERVLKDTFGNDTLVSVHVEPAEDIDAG